MYLPNYGFVKTWLNKCMRKSVSEDPSTINMVKGTKPC